MLAQIVETIDDLTRRLQLTHHVGGPRDGARDVAEGLLGHGTHPSPLQFAMD